MPDSPVPNDSGYFNVMSYGTTGSKYGDDTKAIQAAADAVRAVGTNTSWDLPGLYFPPGYCYGISEPIDLSGIRVIDCQGWISVNFDPTTKPAVYCAGSSSDSGGHVSFRGLHSSWYNTLTAPILRIAGFHGATFDIDACQYVELYGDRTDESICSMAYNTFNFGQVWRVEIRNSHEGSAFAWINENQFYGGVIAFLRVGGPALNISRASQGTGRTIRIHCEGHGYSTGNMVECYGVGGVPTANDFFLVTVIDADTFDLQGSTFAGSHTSGGQCMGPPSYPHNGNVFYSPDIEGNPAIVHMQGNSNRLLGCRMETSGPSMCAFGPDSFGCVVEQTGHAPHGALPSPGDGIRCPVRDYSHGKNFAGFPAMPGAWPAAKA